MRLLLIMRLLLFTIGLKLSRGYYNRGGYYPSAVTITGNTVEHYHHRPDRDEHVNVYLDNIKPGSKSQYSIESDSWTYDTPYDLESFMHYDAFAFAKDTDIPTMEVNVSIQNIV